MRFNLIAIEFQFQCFLRHKTILSRGALEITKYKSREKIFLETTVAVELFAPKSSEGYLVISFLLICLIAKDLVVRHSLFAAK